MVGRMLTSSSRYKNIRRFEFSVWIQTREAPVKINDLEIEAIQACVDAATSGQTQVLGYVDADFQQRNMNGNNTEFSRIWN